MTPESILKFWFEETPRQNHFNATPAFDAAIRERFEDQAIRFAAQTSKAPHQWESTAKGALALIITLDQFPRNMYRGTAAAFTWDDTALNVAKRVVDSGADLKLPMDQRSFIYMPFMHSENLKDQKRCVQLIDQRLDDENSLFHARSHMKVIEQFGRFPHRNEILGRLSRPEEIKYLKDGGYTP